MKLIITTEQHNHKPVYKGVLTTTNNQTYISRSISRQAVISSLKEQAQRSEPK